MTCHNTSNDHNQTIFLRTKKFLSLSSLLFFSLIVTIWRWWKECRNRIDFKIKFGILKKFIKISNVPFIIIVIITKIITTKTTTTTKLSSVVDAYMFEKSLISVNCFSLRQQHHSLYHRSRSNTILFHRQQRQNNQIGNNSKRNIVSHYHRNKNNQELFQSSWHTMRFSEKSQLSSSSSSDNVVINTLVTPGADAPSNSATTSLNYNKAVNKKLFWNREYGTKSDPCDLSLPIIRHAKIICLSNPNDTNNQPLYDSKLLPIGYEIIHIGCHDIDYEKIKSDGGNVIFVSDGMNAKEPLQKLIEVLGEQLIWIHSRSAGIDSFYNDALLTFHNGIMTNSKGLYSSTLAEYTIGACLYFAKDFPKLIHQKQNQLWKPYPISELRGSTLGIIGFGDIGQAAGRLAYAMGMNIIALTRHPRDDEFIQIIFSINNNTTNYNKNRIKIYDTITQPDALNSIFKESDYVLVATPLTKDTHKLIGMEQFLHAKDGCVLINVGRGPVIDEEALIIALQTPSSESTLTNDEQHSGSKSLLKGAALDVTTIEPLPQDSPLWKLNNVLLSPHNMDMTTTFMLESTEFFVQEQLPRFVRGLPLLNPVDVKTGY